MSLETVSQSRVGGIIIRGLAPCSTLVAGSDTEIRSVLVRGETGWRPQFHSMLRMTHIRERLVLRA